MQTPDQLDARFRAFRDQTRYYRSGLVLTTRRAAESADDVALALPADVLSWPQLVLGALRPGQRFIDQSPEVVLQKLRDLAMEHSPFPARLILDLDIALARWERREVEAFWEEYSILQRHPTRAVVAMMYSEAPQMLPHPHLNSILKSEGRLVELE